MATGTGAENLLRSFLKVVWIMIPSSRGCLFKVFIPHKIEFIRSVISVEHSELQRLRICFQGAAYCEVILPSILKLAVGVQTDDQSTPGGFLDTANKDLPHRER
jgi:hypothetical protein